MLNTPRLNKVRFERASEVEVGVEDDGGRSLIVGCWETGRADELFHLSCFACFDPPLRFSLRSSSLFFLLDGLGCSTLTSRHGYGYQSPTSTSTSISNSPFIGSSLIAHDVILNIDVNDINVNRQLDDNDNDNGNASTSTSMTSTTLRQNSDHSPSITGFSFGVLSDPRVSLVRTDDNNYYFVLSSDRSYRLLQTPGKPLWLFGASPTGSGVYEGRTSDLWVGRDDSLRGS